MAILVKLKLSAATLPNGIHYAWVIVALLSVKEPAPWY